MTKAQFYFSSITAMSLLAVGAILQSLGVAGVGLLAVGATIGGLSLVARFQQSPASSLLRLAGPAAVALPVEGA